MFKLIEDTIYSPNDLDTILDEAIKNGIDKNNQKVEYYNIIFAFDFINITTFLFYVYAHWHKKRTLWGRAKSKKRNAPRLRISFFNLRKET